MSNVNITSKNPRINQPKLNSTVLDIIEVKNLKNYFKAKGDTYSNHTLTEKNNAQMKDSNFTYTIYLGTPQGSTLDFCSEKKLCVQGFAEYLYENNIKGTQQFAVSTEIEERYSICDDTVLHELSNFATNYMFPTIVSNSYAFYRDNRPPYVTGILYLSKYLDREPRGVHNRVESEYPFNHPSDGIMKELEDSQYGSSCYLATLLGAVCGSIVFGSLAIVGMYYIVNRWRIRVDEQENNGALRANQQGNYGALVETLTTEPVENSQSDAVALDNLDSQNIETNNGLDPNKC